MKILVTGAAGFIGFHLIKTLLHRHKNSANDDTLEIIGLDSINDYYDVNLKWARLEQLGISKEQVAYGDMTISATSDNLKFIQLNLEDTPLMTQLFESYPFDKVCHLAAQAGVRYSLTHPEAYIQANLVGFFNIINNAKLSGVKHLVYASSSSVYGLNKNMPFKSEDQSDSPVSLYAATKKSNELIAHTYSHLYGLSTIGLRFFTVYGPWGRPDMALFLFVKNILADQPIDVFNYGKMRRDFTYIDDIVQGVIHTLESINAENKPYKIYNIGNSSPVELMDFIKAIEIKLDKKANIKLLPIQPGDVEATFADVKDLQRDFGYSPNTTIQEGINQFVDWYLSFYHN